MVFEKNTWPSSRKHILLEIYSCWMLFFLDNLIQNCWERSNDDKFPSSVERPEIKVDSFIFSILRSVYSFSTTRALWTSTYRRQLQYLTTHQFGNKDPTHASHNSADYATTANNLHSHFPASDSHSPFVAFSAGSQGTIPSYLSYQPVRRGNYLIRDAGSVCCCCRCLISPWNFIQHVRFHSCKSLESSAADFDGIIGGFPDLRSNCLWLVSVSRNSCRWYPVFGRNHDFLSMLWNWKFFVLGKRVILCSIRRIWKIFFQFERSQLQSLP